MSVVCVRVCGALTDWTYKLHQGKEKKSGHRLITTSSYHNKTKPVVISSPAIVSSLNQNKNLTIELESLISSFKPF